MISHTMHSSLLRVGVVFYRCAILQVCYCVWFKGGDGRSVTLGGGGVRLQLLRAQLGALVM